MPVSILAEADVRALIHEELARPEYVSQRTVEAVVGGIGRRDYLRLSRAGAWPTTKERRLIVARTADVLAYLERRIAIREAKPQNDHDDEAIQFARVGARRVSR